MKTNIIKKGDSIVIAVEGKLTHENQTPFRNDLSRIKTDSAGQNIMFDFSGLEFVGSSGISSFIQILKDFSEGTSNRPKYYNVKSEFQRVIRAFDEDALIQFYEDDGTVSAIVASSELSH